MAPHLRAKISRKQELLRCKSRGLEAERKGLLALACFPEVQENLQPPPFLNTALGKLPPESPFKIHQCPSVAPRFRADSQPQKDIFTAGNALLDESSSAAPPCLID